MLSGLQFTKRSFGSVLRRSPVSLAPKKKGGGGKGDAGSAPETFAPGSDHIFNIFQNAEDPKVLPDSAYPDWLWSLADRQKSYSELESMFVYGKDIEKATLGDYRRFLRFNRKLVIKLNNKRLQKRLSNQEIKLVN
jgi:large subunit ribosomal protein L54